MELGRIARARGVRLLTLTEVDSTNEEAKRLIGAGDGGPLWIVAEKQTRGRGRLGRNWASIPGNLHASLALSGFGEAAIAPQLGFVAGVAALGAVRGLCAGADDAGKRIALKWPNDLLLDGAKLGGILLEGVSLSPCGFAAVVGVGVNCAGAPEGLPYAAAALPSFGVGDLSAARLFRALSDAFVDALDLWDNGAGFPLIREAWLKGAAGLGAPASVTLSRGEVVEGRFESIDASGRLLLATAGGTRTIDAGDVTLAHAQSEAPTLLSAAS